MLLRPENYPQPRQVEFLTVISDLCRVCPVRRRIPNRPVHHRSYLQISRTFQPHGSPLFLWTNKPVIHQYRHSRTHSWHHSGPSSAQRMTSFGLPTKIKHSALLKAHSQRLQSSHSLMQVSSHKFAQMPVRKALDSSFNSKELTTSGSSFRQDPTSSWIPSHAVLFGVTWAIMKCKMFLAGLPHFRVVTDHHPLVPILNSHCLDEIENPRLQRLKTRIMAYNPTAEWLKGTKNTVPDAQSRNPPSNLQPDDMLGKFDHNSCQEVSMAELRSLANDGQESVHLKDLCRHAESDQVYTKLLGIIFNGFPDHRSLLPDECKRYWPAREHLKVKDGLILHGCRLLIPSAM